LSEEKIARVRDAFLTILRHFLVELDLPKNFDKLPKNERIVTLTNKFEKMDTFLFEMCKLGISGAEIRGVPSKEIERLMKELEETSEKLRYNLIKGDMDKVRFLISQFNVLRNKIILSVWNMLSPNPLYEFSKMTSKPVASRNVFIVHGRDDKPKLELARMLEKLSFNVIILSEEADKGRTLIEKLEQETIDIGFAFVILTPDDVGMERSVYEKKIIEPEKYQNVGLCYRARQNVILELGYFIGKIGRNRVCCLYKGNVELPSDIHGVIFKKFNESVEECYKGIIEELKAAGYEIRI